jgi:preprotein translocase YajC subunit
VITKSYTLFAQEGPPPAAKPPELPFFMQGPFLLALIGLFFVVFILPKMRQQKREQQELQNNLKPGAKVILSSGIIARVVKDHEDGELTVSSDDTRLRVLKTSVISAQGDDAAAAKK